MALKDFFAKTSQRNIEKKEKFKQLEEDFLMKQKLAERQKSANEREMERFMKEEREDLIKEKLNQFRKKQRDAN